MRHAERGDSVDDGDHGGDATRGGDDESDGRSLTADRVDIVVIDGDDRHTLRVDRGRSLRDALLDAGLSPYASMTRRLNCGGRGLCATCGVRVHEGPAANHWHDRLAERFGYPRLSCQVVVEGAMTVELVDKHVWGGREHDEAPGGDEGGKEPDDVGGGGGTYDDADDGGERRPDL